MANNTLDDLNQLENKVLQLNESILHILENTQNILLNKEERKSLDFKENVNLIRTKLHEVIDTLYSGSSLNSNFSSEMNKENEYYYSILKDLKLKLQAK